MNDQQSYRYSETDLPKEVTGPHTRWGLAMTRIRLWVHAFLYDYSEAISWALFLSMAMALGSFGIWVIVMIAKHGNTPLHLW